MSDLDRFLDARVEKRSIVISGHATSISLEKPFWDELKKRAQAEEKSLAALIAELDEKRQGNLSSAIRLYVLYHLSAR